MERVRAAPGEGQQLRPLWSRPLLRPLGLPDHRDPVRLERLQPLLPQFLHAPGPPDFPALLRRPPRALLRISPRPISLSGGAPGVFAPPGLGLVLWGQPVCRAARLVGPAVHQPLLVAGGRRALLPALAIRRRSCLPGCLVEDLRRGRGSFTCSPPQPL